MKVKIITKYQIVILLLLFCLFSGIVTILTKKPKEKIDSIFDLDDRYWSFLISDISESAYNSGGARYDGIQDNGIDYINYFIKADEAVAICYYVKNGNYEQEELKEAEAIVKNLMNTFYTYGYFPRPEYKEFEYGWVSSMDAPTIMLASQMLYELTQENGYKNFVEELSKYVLLTTDKNGFNFVDKNGDIWPLEYARQNAEEETNYYVLNGSLVGYLSTKAIAKVNDNKDLKIYCEKVEKSYKKYFSQYHIDETWSRYMLNPSNVIPIHYMIFEEKLFRAAYYLNNIPSFNKEYKFRENALSNVLRVEFYEKEDEYEYYCLRATSPNYYQIDTYGTKIEIYDKNDNLIATNEKKDSGSMATRKETFYKSMILNGKISLSEKPAYYKVYSVNAGNEFLLFERKIDIKKSVEIKKLDYKITLGNDMEEDKVSNDSIYNIVPELEKKAEEADIIFSLSKTHKLHEMFYAIELENLSLDNMNIRLKLYDKNGEGVSRYYTELIPGKNLIVFDARGFADYADIENISKIFLVIYDSDIKEPVKIKLGELKGFSDYKNYYNYIMSTDYKINPQ